MLDSIATSSPAARDEAPTLDRLMRCYEGGVPAVVCTADADGVPNVTYISRVHQVDADRVAISNQFMSKTSQNLVANPLASLLLIDPVTYQEYRLSLTFERTERRGPVFERLRHDVEQLAEEMGLQSVFKLRAADIFRVAAIEALGPFRPEGDPVGPARSFDALAAFASRLHRATDLDTVVEASIAGLDRILGYQHALLLLLDESGTRLYTIAGRGFGDENVGAEVMLGDGPIGRPLERGELVRSTGLRQLAKYSRVVRRSFEQSGVAPGVGLPVPGLVDADSRVVVPIHVLGRLVGGIVVEDRAVAAFQIVDEQILSTVAGLVGGSIEAARTRGAAESEALSSQRAAPDDGDRSRPASPAIDSECAVAVRCFDVDGSVFIDGVYLIKGVAGRILRSLVSEHLATGRVEFTNRELRLDPSLDLPGFKDNLESRLILLKRRLDERSAPCRIHKVGRGRFRLDVDRPVRLDVIGEPPI